MAQRRSRNIEAGGMSIAHSIEIAAPLERVWNVITNVENYPVVLRETTAIQPSPPTRSLNPVTVGAKYQQTVCDIKYGRSSVFEFCVTNVEGPSSPQEQKQASSPTDTTTFPSCCCLKGASQHLGGDFTSTQFLERLDERRTNYCVTYALIPRSWWARCFLWCMRTTLLKKGRESAQHMCQDIQSAAEAATEKSSG